LVEESGAPWVIELGYEDLVVGFGSAEARGRGRGGGPAEDEVGAFGGGGDEDDGEKVFCHVEEGVYERDENYDIA
jgi:hypothetical protein